MEKVPLVARNEAGIVACISLPFTKLESRLMLVLPEPFQVTLDPETKPEPLTVKAMSFVCPATAPLGLIIRIAAEQQEQGAYGRYAEKNAKCAEQSFARA